MSYYYSVIKDHPLGFWKLDDLSGIIASDASGCNNYGVYTGGILKSSMPMTSGGIHSIKINSSNYLELDIVRDFSISTGVGGIAIDGTEDNDFTLETWFHPKTITAITRIFADSSGIGIYYEKGNIIFKVKSNEVYYSVPDPDRVLHVVGTYTTNSINLYLDGKLVSTKEIKLNSFQNSLLTIGCGPANGLEYFTMDSCAAYRYALNQRQILNHYLDSVPGSEIEIVSPDGGELFKITDRHQDITEKYIYPVQKNWQYFLNDNLLYRSSTNSIYLNPNSLSGQFYEIISLAYWKTFISSRIEWSSTKGVDVYISTVSEQGPWQQCENGSQLPGFSKNDFSDDKIIYIKVEMNSTDATKFVPELYYLGIDFYTDKKIYSHNSSSTLSTDATWDINLGSSDNTVLHRYKNDGVKTDSSGFYVQTDRDTKNVEFILTPYSILGGYLLYNKTNSVEYSLYIGAAGEITKNNISNIYINGVDISQESNIQPHIYLDEPNYVLIKSSNNMKDKIWLNAKVDGAVKTGVLGDNIYNNIALYENEVINHAIHYDMYIGKHTAVAYDSSIELTENVVKTYSKDRVLLNNI